MLLWNLITIKKKLQVVFTRVLFKTNIIVPTYSNHSDGILYLITNDTLSLQQKIILTVLVPLNAFLNLRNLTVLGLNLLILNLLIILFLYLPLCALLWLGSLLLARIMLETSILIILKFVMFIIIKEKNLLGIILSSILALLFSICVITTM